MAFFCRRPKTKRRKRESLPLRYLVNGRPGSRSASSKATLPESTIQENVEQMGRLLPTTNEDVTENLNVTKDNDEIGEKEDEQKRIHSAEVFVDLRGRK